MVTETHRLLKFYKKKDSNIIKPDVTVAIDGEISHVPGTRHSANDGQPTQTTVQHTNENNVSHANRLQPLNNNDPITLKMFAIPKPKQQQSENAAGFVLTFNSLLIVGSVTLLYGSMGIFQRLGYDGIPKEEQYNSAAAVFISELLKITASCFFLYKEKQTVLDAINFYAGVSIIEVSQNRKVKNKQKKMNHPIFCVRRFFFCKCGSES